MIKYLGSKRGIISRIVEVVKPLRGVKTIVDPFSGTSRVGQAFKQEGYKVIASDHNAYAATIAMGYIQANKEEVEEEVSEILTKLSKVRGKSGYITQKYCLEARYFQEKNGKKIDAIRDRIEKLKLSPEIKAVVLISLMEAADRVDSTTGVQMAYLKQWSARSHNDLELRVPKLFSQGKHGKCEAHQSDVLDVLKKFHGDLVYLDPPYNQHSYLSNYHIWETLVRWDHPETYGIAMKRVDCKERKSDFNSKRKFKAAFEAMVESASAKYLLVSFNNEGYLSKEEIEQILKTRGKVITHVIDYKRYVGAQIGIHNLKGEKVGKVSHLKNKEFLFLVKVKK